MSKTVAAQPIVGTFWDSRLNALVFERGITEPPVFVDPSTTPGFSDLADGSATAPSLSFNDDSGLGLWRIGTDNAGFSGSLAIKGPRPWADLKAWGLALDGVTNDAVLAQSVLTAIQTAGGGRVYHSGGILKCNDGLTYDGSNLEIVNGPDAVWDFSGAPYSEEFFTIRGTVAADVPLTANAVEGATSVSVAAGAEAGFAAGDWVKISSQGFFANKSPVDDDQKIGEITRVASTASGSITLVLPLVGGTYNTADTAGIAKMTLAENITWTGGRVIGGDLNANHIAFMLERTLRPRFDHIRIENTSNVAVLFRDTISGILEDSFLIGGTSTETSFYGIQFAHATQDSVVKNTTFWDFRHPVDNGGTDGINATPGIPRRNTADNCTSHNATAHAYHSHDGAEDFSVINCKAYDAIGSGVSVGCPSSKVLGGVFDRCDGGVIVMNGTEHPTEYTVTGVTIRNSVSHGIKYQNNVGAEISVNAGATIRAVNITGNNLYKAGTASIALLNTATWRMHSVNISDNIVDSQGSGTSTIQLNKCDQSNCNNNIVRNNVATGRGINLSDVTTVTAVGNNIHFASLSSGRGFNLLTAINCDIASNIISNAGTGLVIDSASTDGTLWGNRFISCTSSYSSNVTAAGWLVGGNMPEIDPPNIASAAALTLLGSGPNDLYDITGTTNITSITATGFAGRIVTLRFTGILTVVNGSNLKLDGDYVTAADYTLTLMCDGTDWREVSRGRRQTVRASADGAVGTPAFTWATDPDNGLYRIGTNNWAMAAGGAKMIEMNATQLAFFGVALAARPGAYTQTFATADRTHAARTGLVLTDSSGGTADQTVQALTDPADAPATADALRDDLVANLIPQLRNNFAELTDEMNKVIADLADTAQAVNSLIDDHQSLGLAT